MQKNLLFGAAYYPEYMPYERIDTDFSMMKKALEHSGKRQETDGLS